MANTFELVTSLRYDPKLSDTPWNNWEDNPRSALFFLPYHYDRLDEAARRFEWLEAIQALESKGGRAQGIAFLKAFCEQGVENNREPLRIRITLSREGGIKATHHPTVRMDNDLIYAATFKPNSIGTFNFPKRQYMVYIDTKHTPLSMYTSYKTTERAHYDAARDRLGITANKPEEVILYNREGDVMEGSVRNIAFWRADRWVTPSLESGCLPGTTRRWLIEHGLVDEGRIRLSDVQFGEWVLLFNGVEGCLLGVVSARSLSNWHGPQLSPPRSRHYGI